MKPIFMALTRLSLKPVKRGPPILQRPHPPNTTSSPSSLRASPPDVDRLPPQNSHNKRGPNPAPYLAADRKRRNFSMFQVKLENLSRVGGIELQLSYVSECLEN
jgi:hypothetical protein